MIKRFRLDFSSWVLLLVLSLLMVGAYKEKVKIHPPSGVTFFEANQTLK